jgi:flagellar hook-associated protein 2
MAGIQVSGLASGMDTASMIDQLMSVEQIPRTAMTDKQTLENARKSALSTIDGKLSLLRTAAQALGSAGTWADSQSVTSSDTTKITVARTSSGAAPGGFDVGVSQLASADQHTFAYSVPTSDSDLQIGGASVHLTAGMSLDDAVAQINNSDDAKVYAINVNSRLVLAAKDTGTTNAFTASGSAITEDTSAARAARDAKYTIDGQDYTSASNTVSDTLPGVSLTFRSVTSSDTTVTVGSPGPDPATVTAAVKSFVSAYNDTIDSIRGFTTEQKVINPQTDNDKTKGVLFNDSGLNSILQSLRGTLLTTVGSNPAGMSLLSQIGISTGSASDAVNQDAVAGKITFDADALTTALENDPSSVQKLLGGTAGTSGFGQALEGVLAPQVQAGGVMDGRIQSSTDQLSSLADQLSTFDERMTNKRNMLEAQFSNLETVLGQNQSLASQLSSQLAAL